MRVDHSSIDKLMSQLGLAYKKSLIAIARRRAKIVPLRADWFKHRLLEIAALPDRVVFIDEAAVKT